MIQLFHSFFRSLRSQASFTFEKNLKETPCDSFFLNRKSPATQVEPINLAVALGIPPARGMFKTPTPTPPSSHDSSPLASPRFPLVQTQCMCTSGSALQVPQLSRHRGPTQQTNEHCNGAESPKNLKFTFDVTSCDLKLDVITSNSSNDVTTSHVNEETALSDVSSSLTRCDRLKQFSRRFSDQTTISTQRESVEKLTLYFRASSSTPSTPHLAP